jgi:antitoxin (DNA-binding transcriptional repressor) of toxin-antitoxin stability system
MAEDLRIDATEFENGCRELLDRIAAREIARLVITKGGRTVAVVTPPAAEEEAKAIFGFLRGSVVMPAGFDLTEPVMDEPPTLDKSAVRE